MAVDILQVTDETFEREVLDSELPVLVDFWAPWCGPCKMIAPVLVEIGAAHAERLRIVKINVDENPIIAEKYSVLSLPTMSVYSGGQVVKRITGAKPKSMLLKELAEFL